MDSIAINSSKTFTLTLPSDPTSNAVTVNLYHEFGNTIKSSVSATRTGTGVYTVTFGQEASGLYVFSSCGVYRIEFVYTVATVEYKQNQYVEIFTPYTDSDSFFDEHPELIDSHEDVFNKYEARARAIIDTYCGQNFNFYEDKSIILDGNNHKNLRLPLPITTVKEIILNSGDADQELVHYWLDPTANTIEKVRQPGNFESSFYIRFKPTVIQSTTPRIVDKKFRKDCTYQVTGDFGWRYVPTNIKLAANLLIADLMNDDSEYRRHGISSISMDTTSFSMNPNFYESTGNIDVDVLLMDYTLFVMDYIV